MEGNLKKRCIKFFSVIVLIVLFSYIPFVPGIYMPGEAAGVSDLEIMPVSAMKYDKAYYLIPMGNTVGIKMESDGVIVVGLADVNNGGSAVAPAARAGIRTGDIITRLNSKKIRSVEDFREAIDKYAEKEITVRVLRDGREQQFSVEPVINKSGKPELGLWLRDGIIGIGTITYYDPKNDTFGALGHSVCDIDTGVMLPLRSGSIMKSSITSVKKGAAGKPGELKGNFDLLCSIGELHANTNCGIFGTLDKAARPREIQPIPVAKRSEIKAGEAVILSNINGTSVEEYKIEISRIYPRNEANTRDMMITVRDERLIEATGGIVQGMSGSPIIQDGKLVGAVTHVLINDPTRGYGISMENMLGERCGRKAKAA